VVVLIVVVVVVVVLRYGTSSSASSGSPLRRRRNLLSAASRGVVSEGARFFDRSSEVNMEADPAAQWRDIPQGSSAPGEVEGEVGEITLGGSTPASGS
jgi:hypothetical protein